MENKEDFVGTVVNLRGLDQSALKSAIQSSADYIALLDVFEQVCEALEIARGHIAIQAFAGNKLLDRMHQDVIEPALTAAAPYRKTGV